MPCSVFSSGGGLAGGAYGKGTGAFTCACWCSGGGMASAGGGPLQVVPVVAALWLLDVLVGPGLECEHQLMPRPRVVRRGRVHQVVLRPDEGWSVRQNPVVGQGAS